MENGEWRMENGEWKMENGEWRMLWWSGGFSRLAVGVTPLCAYCQPAKASTPQATAVSSAVFDYQFLNPPTVETLNKHSFPQTQNCST